MEQMIIEMTYITKGKTLLCAWWVSLNFWDRSLLQIFKTSVSLIKDFIALIENSTESGVQ